MTSYKVIIKELVYVEIKNKEIFNLAPVKSTRAKEQETYFGLWYAKFVQQCNTDIMQVMF